MSCTHVMPEHLLLGMLRDRQNPLLDLLLRSDIDANDIKTELENSVNNNKEVEGEGSIATPALDEKASNILKLSILEARLQHSQIVNVEHVILAILHDQTINGAKQVLESKGLNYNTAMKHLMQTTSKPQNGIGISEEEDENIMSRNNTQGDKKSQTTKTTVADRGGKTPVLDKFATDLTGGGCRGQAGPRCGQRERDKARDRDFVPTQEEQPYPYWRAGCGQECYC